MKLRKIGAEAVWTGFYGSGISIIAFDLNENNHPPPILIFAFRMNEEIGGPLLEKRRGSFCLLNAMLLVGSCRPNLFKTTQAMRRNFSAVFGDKT